MEIYLENTNNEQICFRHAVKAAMNDEYISIHGFDDSDCGASGAWHKGGCVECDKERKND